MGSTINACTRGLWMYKKVIKIDKKDVHMLVLDTEGLNSTDVNKNSDSRYYLFK